MDKDSGADLPLVVGGEMARIDGVRFEGDATIDYQAFRVRSRDRPETSSVSRLIPVRIRPR